MHGDPTFAAGDGADDLPTRFAITPFLDTEIDVAAAGWVGLTPSADHELRVEVTSAVIARFIGSSISTARKYVRSMEEHVPRDAIIRELCASHLHQYDMFYRTIEVRTNAPIGIFAFDLAMIRSRSSIQLMLTTARQGFLIEPCLIARSVMEQFAYALRVWESDEDDDIFYSKPQALISHLNKANASAGRDYGNLSRLAHYDPKMHFRFIGEKEEMNSLGEMSSTVIQRSWKFKIISLAWLFYILDLKFRVFRQCYGSHENFSQISAIATPLSPHFDEFFEGVDFPAINLVRSLF